MKSKIEKMTLLQRDYKQINKSCLLRMLIIDGGETKFLRRWFLSVGMAMPTYIKMVRSYFTQIF